MDIKDLLDQKKTRKTEWVSVPGTEIKFHVKYLLPMDQDDIGRRRKLYKKAGGKRDHRLFLEELMNETVVDWVGLEFEGGPFPCTPENKLELNKVFPPFRDIWFKASGLAASIGEEDEEEDELGN